VIGYDRTVRGAMRELFLVVARLGGPERLARWVDHDLTHLVIPPAFRRAPTPERLSALDQAIAAAADYERRFCSSDTDIGYIEELW
jgi:hypothetical protein